jgi:hypothetical protein
MRGVYPKIPAVYSEKLAKVIDMCLKIDPTRRPSVKELLKMIENNHE